MSQRTFTLPLRLASSSRPQSQYVCRRCLATQSTNTHPSTGVYQTPWLPEGTPLPENYNPSLPFEKRTLSQTGEDGKPQHYRLTKTDWYLKKGLPHAIPPQYLQHSTASHLAHEERQQREKFQDHKEILGVVVSSGKMDRTVKVRLPGQRFEKKVGKYFSAPTNHLVHDPNNSLITGDVVFLHRLNVSKTVKHVVASIKTPFGKPIADRPHIPTPDERLAAYKEARFGKLKRRNLRRRAAQGEPEAINELREMGLDPGHNVAAGKGETYGLQPNIGKTRDAGKGAIRGQKGQKLPKGVLPGGKHEVGKIDERARHNKEAAMKMNEKAEGSLLEAKEKGEELEQQGVGADPKSDVTMPRGRVD